MAEQSEVALKLKALRERAGLSVRAVADRLEKPHSSYSYYEDSFKGRHIPAELAQALIPIFREKGVDPTELLALTAVADEILPRSTGGAGKDSADLHAALRNHHQSVNDDTIGEGEAVDEQITHTIFTLFDKLPEQKAWDTLRAEMERLTTRKDQVGHPRKRA